MCEIEVKSTEEANEENAGTTETPLVDEGTAEEGETILIMMMFCLYQADEEDANPIEQLDLEQSVSVKDVKSFSQREKVDDEQEFIETVVRISRVAKVVKGGRRFSFSAISVVGDGKGSVGVGFG